MYMQKYNNSYGYSSHEMITALRDIVDVLYDGYCEVLKDEELCSTIHKKIKELKFCSDREREYKLFKVLSILNCSKKKMDTNCYLNWEVVKSMIDEVVVLCLEMLKNYDSRET